MSYIITKEALKVVQSNLPLASTINTTQQIMVFDGADAPAARISAAGLFSSSYGTCNTAATVSAKEVVVSDFILLKNKIVSVLFTNAIDSSGTTLNVSSTGAKPVYYRNEPLTQGVVRPGCIVTLQYDGTRYNIIIIEGLQQSDTDSDLWVDMGLSSGVKWAKRNIDLTQPNGFAATEYQYSCTFFSWGNTDGHNPTSNSSFSPYSWGSDNSTEPYVSSQGARITYPASAAPSFDAARANLGSPWRLPTTGEFAELFANIDFVNANDETIDTTVADKRVSVNGVLGIRIRSKTNGATLFFPCSGLGYGSSWYIRGSSGYYWSSSLYSQTDGRRLRFNSGGVNPQYYSSRFSGFAVRPVQ